MGEGRELDLRPKLKFGSRRLRLDCSMYLNTNENARESSPQPAERPASQDFSLQVLTPVFTRNSR